MNKLIPMTDFVLEQKEHQNKIDSNVLTVIYNYAKFLKQPLKLGMFVPCDEDGNVLKFDYPQNKAFDDVAQIEFEKQYQKAKERCLFAELNVMNIRDFYFIERDNKSLFCIGLDNIKTVKDLVKYDLQLTQTAINLIGL